MLCPICGTEFLATRHNKVCCSNRCAKVKWARDKGSAYFRKRYSDNAEEFKRRSSEHRKRLKDKCYQGYGGYVCNCCDVSGEKFVTLDHVANDGSKHRYDIGNEPVSLYRWIIKNNFPSIIQVLCWNCNCAKNLNGGVCPHKELING